MAKRLGDVRMHQQLETFLKVGREQDFFAGRDRLVLEQEIADWLPGFHAVLDPAALSAAHAKTIQPQLDVFAETHLRVTSLKLLLDGWAIAGKQSKQLAAKIPRLLVGEDEDEDLEKLKVWPGVFAALFDVKGLPKALQPGEVKSHLQAHEKAALELPTTTAGIVFRTGRANLVERRTVGIELQKRMHSSLDGAFGSDGKKAYSQKSPFGYDRRILGGGRNRGQRAADPVPEEEVTETPPVVPPTSV